MATSLMGPFLTESASNAAPVPRPPQPTRATLMVLFSAAWTCGSVIPASTEAPVTRVAPDRNSRRDLFSGKRVSFESVSLSQPAMERGRHRARGRIGFVKRACLIALWAAVAACGQVVFEASPGSGKGRNVVLVSGDDEYRSEEALPQLARILSKRHGFRCTVLFAIDPKTGEINPQVNNNIPGLEALKTADLMVIFTRFRNLPDEQMKYVA